jgi:hypothetical protein
MRKVKIGNYQLPFYGAVSILAVIQLVLILAFVVYESLLPGAEYELVEQARQYVVLAIIAGVNSVLSAAFFWHVISLYEPL